MPGWRLLIVISSTLERSSDNFILLAFVIFQMVKVVNKVRLMDTPPPPPTPEDVMLLREIRDSLKK